MQIISLSIFFVSILLASSSVSALDNSRIGWVVLSQIEISEKAERIKYARFLKEQHYQVPYRIIPELTPQETEWIKSRRKEIDDARNNIKDKKALLMNSEEGRAWLAMSAQYISSTLYLQNELKRSLAYVINSLDMIIESKDVFEEKRAWSLLVYALLDQPLNGDNLYKAVNALENEKCLVFTRKCNFLLLNMSVYIARQINWYILYGFFEGKID